MSGSEQGCLESVRRISACGMLSQVAAFFLGGR
jgi:hypothetical protein